MSSRPELKLDWCSYAAAKYAVEHWHYSRSMPTPPLAKVGVWEDNKFIGCILFSRGANKHLGSPYGLDAIQVAELTRVALTEHQTQVTRILTIALKMMTRWCQGLRLIISYADPNQNHIGVIYQAGGWLYAGQGPMSYIYRDKQGRKWHQRQVSVTGVKPQYGQPRRVPRIADCQRISQLGKHKYLYPLDGAMRENILPLAQPYPKRPKDSSEPPAVPAGEGGAAPTRALQLLPGRQAWVDAQS